MKKNLIIIIFILSSSSVKPCGWAVYEDTYFFYNIFLQENISNPDLYPFLRDEYNVFYNHKEEDNKGNILLWKKLLPNWDTSSIKKALYSSYNNEFESVWQNKNQDIEIRAKRYLVFARKCSNFFEFRNELSWSYDEILDKKRVDVESILEEGIQLYDSENNPQLKARYAYQVIRIFHYSKQYDNAISFFENKVINVSKKNEIYYYLLDQVAGCYYSKKNYEKAAYLFLNVFNHSLDRKKSAFLSYNFCVNKGAEGKPYFIQLEDSISYITLKSIRSFSDKLDGISKLMKLAPDNDKAELLFMRAINDIERNIWQTQTGMKEMNLPNLKPENIDYINNLYKLGDIAIKSPKIKHKDFWKLSLSYLSFLKGNITQAKHELSQIQNGAFSKQIEILNYIYEILNWKSISTIAQENLLSKILGDVISSYPIYKWDVPKPGWKYLIMDHVAHLYYKKGELAKAFLIHNHIETINRISSLELIDDLIFFIKKENKSSFEKLIMQRTLNIKNMVSAEDYINFIKGVYYMHNGNPYKAYPYFVNSEIDKKQEYREDYLGNNISAKIFSNNVKEGFSNGDSIMVDSVYLASIFSFITPQFSMSDLAMNLIKLDSLTKDPKQWKCKLAYYLLGNYYFNISNTGYYRGSLLGMSNCCNYRHFNTKYFSTKRAKELITNKSGYNLYDVEDYYDAYHGLAQKAYEYYKKVISISTDKELNARCLYLMAKCELNTMYNNEDEYYYYYNGGIDEISKNYKKSFKELKENYQDTKFYKMIIKECSFFKYYCSL